MDNGMENMLDMYLFETNSLLEQLDEILLNAEKAQTFTEDDVNEIFRIMHTIKGSSAMMEFSTLMTIAHRIEDLFYFIRENGIEAIPSEDRTALFDLMFRSTDKIRSEVEKVENNEPLDDNIDQFVTEVNTFINKISNVQELSSDKEQVIKASSSPQSASDYSLRIYFDEGCGMENLRAFMLTVAIKDVCESFTFSPSDVETNQESSSIIIEKGFILSFHSKEDLDKAIGVVKGSGNIQTYEVLDTASSHPHKEETQQQEVVQNEVPKVAAPQNKPIEPKPSQTTQKPANHPTNNKQSLISVNLSKLDSLMAIVGEIVITESMVTASPEIQAIKSQGYKLDNFTKSARQLRKLTDEMQDTVMSIRMVPVSGVFQKMNRIVRDMGQKLGKDVRLTIIGEDTEVDKTIVDGIGDPIMHIVRNSMDHGIEENVEDRIRAGKDPQGEIILKAEHTGSEVIISVTDDGAGIDPEKVLTKARNNGILTKPENEYSQKEILSLLMMPGFSTNETVTEFSGRGVGMDVVKKNVEKVGGVVSIASEFGRGTVMTLKIPLTLAIVDGMEIAVGKSIFTIPINNIRQSFKVSSSEIIHDASRGELICKMNEFYPIIRLYELYNIETECTNIEDGILVWVESGEKSYCLFIDELLGEQQVVVKPLPGYLNSFNIKNSGISGCTIMGDGNISLILDVTNLYAVFQNNGF